MLYSPLHVRVENVILSVPVKRLGRNLDQPGQISVPPDPQPLPRL